MPIEPIYRQLGSHIALRRSELGLTQEEAAKTAKMERPLWSKLENGRYRVQVHDLPAIARALGVSAVDLVLGALGRASVTPAVARKGGAV